jgi:UDP-N-acetylmuramate--alanine ligase
MYMKKIQKEHIYIIGIAGKGLNSIAEFCVSKGYKVSGSDQRESPETLALQKRGVSLFLNQDGSHISKKYTKVIYSSIIPEHHPERVRARKLNIPELSRVEFLKYITGEYIRVSIAGSHGKSTTSALTSLAFESEVGSVNAITGAFIKEFNSYQKSGTSPYCVLEACEYSKSFLHIPGDYTIITSLEKSHMEYFGTEESMNNAFKEFILKHKSSATIIINGDTPVLRQISSIHTGRVITCGFNLANDYVISDISFDQDGSTFSLYKDTVCIEKDIRIKIPGGYNMSNVAFTFVLLHVMNYQTKKYRKIVQNFTGVGRRFELIQKEKTVFIDDFAHHPTQVRNLLTSIKQFFPQKKIFAVFEPRQYHLFKTFLKEYGASFKWADEVYITDIVPALGDTQEDISSLSTQDVIDNVRLYSKPKQVRYARNYEEIVDSLRLKDLSDVVVATIGAGPIYRVRDLLVNKVQ